MRTYIILTLLFLVVNHGCKSRNPTRELVDNWLVEDLRYNGRSIFWDDVAALGNIMEFKESGLYRPMLRKGQMIEPHGQWEVTKEADAYYVEISGCADTMFNGKFQVHLSYRKNTYPKQKILELTKKNLYIIAQD